MSGFRAELVFDNPETCPVVATSAAVDTTLHVTVQTEDVTDLRASIQEFQNRYGNVRVEHFVNSRGETAESNIVPVDVRRLTDRQREVLETATEMGYFEYPRDANATEVADELGIQPSTFTEHLNVAQSKILDELQFGE